MFVSVFAYLLDIFKFNILGFSKYILLLISILLYGIFILRGKQIFEYDSDGETLNIRNRNIIVLFSEIKNDDFPKYKLVKFEIKDFIIYKRLYITITSKKKNFITLKYDISYLTRREKRDLKFSLNRISRFNREKAKFDTTK
ncbi:hypothetical protein [Halpernia sp.]|uniref:hypothetical protein n=1 Tax=Halpernia sp. TaxID=2782209 RepID=UPI003A911DD1